MKTVTFPNGESVPALGLGTWHMGERGANRAAEADALRAGIDLGMDLGMTVVHTAEMYADGGAEYVVGDAVQGRRGKVYIVSKVLPHNASRSGTIQACEASLQRMNIECMDLYLLHWPGSHPLAETIAGFEDLMQAGKIRARV